MPIPTPPNVDLFGSDLVGVNDGTLNDKICGKLPAIVVVVVVDEFVGVCSFCWLVNDVVVVLFSDLGVENKPIVGFISFVDVVVWAEVPVDNVKAGWAVVVVAGVVVDVAVVVSAGLVLKLNEEVPKFNPPPGVVVVEIGWVVAVVLVAGVVVAGVVVFVVVPNKLLVPVARPLKLGKVTELVGLDGFRNANELLVGIVGFISGVPLAKLILPLNVDDFDDDWLKLADCCYFLLN